MSRNPTRIECAPKKKLTPNGTIKMHGAITTLKILEVFHLRHIGVVVTVRLKLSELRRYIEWADKYKKKAGNKTTN